MILVKSFALIIFVSLVIMSFQNCSPSANTGLLGSKTSNPTTAQVATTAAPFAYDLVADTISYNSCVGQDLNGMGIHGLKIGVNEGFVDSLGTGVVKAGLKLRTDFLSYLGKNISPVYPSSVITPAQIQFVLKNSDANKDAFIQYAVRKRADLTTAIDLIQPSSGSVFVYGRDGLVDNATLNTDPVLAQLTKNVLFGDKGLLLSEGPRIYNLYDVTDPRPIEASFNYSNYTDETYSATTSVAEPFGFGEAYSDRVRQRFNSSGTDKYVLAITFGNPFGGDPANGLNDPKRKEINDKTKAYGRSYALRFESLSSVAGWKNNLLKQVTESNLVDNTPATGTSWSCENFVIMKLNQWNNTKPNEPACVPLNATDLQSSTISGAVKRIRRHYAQDKWDIGLFYSKNSLYVPATRVTQPLCLVPKAADCYLPTTISNTDIGINYDPNTECYLYASSVMGVTYSGNLNLEDQRKLGRCAQYASVCIRSSTNY
jgi:hypothetical protein